MTSRDRTVVMVLGLLAMLAAFWFLLLSPKNGEVGELKDQIAAGQARLQTAQTELQSATAAKATYRRDYKTVANLGKAVPADDDVPSLVFQLQQASTGSKVAFASIKLTGTAAAAAAPVAATPTGQVAGLAAEQKGTTTGTTAAPAPAAAATPEVAAAQTAFAGLPPGAAIGEAGFPTMPFDFQFGTVFDNFETLMRKLGKFTKVVGDKVTVSGRLLTIDGFSLVGFPDMKASVHATAFLQPADAAAAATAAATPGAPAVATASAGTPAPAVATATPAVGVGR
ncbi:hypothetical protein DSM112329_03079 [Paraconexibacter sp. AEG42_29]|uniref:Tfp pilus assembly protein PilO n=1 Tax=Paraconexibacter sp. AEG42_29 TaxID=2997339 RepID=A0AAU7AX30_9ACTN